jgi:hypothetical protein
MRTGELCNLHGEWRSVGLQVIAALGITAGTDLSRYDHWTFWKKRFLLGYIDETEKLGRHMRNVGTGRGRKNQTADMEIDWRGIPVNRDEWRGNLVLQCGGIQDIIDNWKGINLHRFMRVIPNEDWLPPVKDSNRS